MILDFLLLFYSPSWKLVLLIGACSVTLGVLTQQVETLSWRPLGIGQSLQLHTGFIFALALVLCLRLSGARDFKKLLTIAVGATAIWPVTTNLVSAVGRPDLPTLGRGGRSFRLARRRGGPLRRSHRRLCSFVSKEK
jgi:hypothetical protein